MSERSVEDSGPVSFKERLAGSQAFSALFREGMALVEETAAYLDGPGRKESKALARTAALAYATESMRLTTRLMQLASWLLAASRRERRRDVARPGQSGKNQGEAFGLQVADPETRENAAEDAGRSDRALAQLVGSVRRLDATIHGPAQPVTTRANPVERQLGLLKAAFEQTRPLKQQNPGAGRGFSLTTEAATISSRFSRRPS